MNGASLRANRNFTLLWTGDVLSEFGSQASGIAMPLLVLALTGSPARAGLVGFARAIAYPLTPLPAGVIADRCDRRHVMLGCAAGRALAMGSLVTTLLLGRPPFAQLLAVAFVNAALYTQAAIAERGLLPLVVAPETLATAVAANEAREAVATIGGPPLGGALLAAGRALPFLADAASFVAAGAAVLAVRLAPGSTRPASTHPRPVAAIREGMAWLWGSRFLRDGSLLYAVANVSMGSVELLAVLVARHHGNSSAAIGLALAIVGAGGVAGALVAGRVRGALTPRATVLAEPWLAVVSVPLLLVCHGAVLIGLAVALFVAPMPASSSVVVGRRLALAPDHLRGRVQAAASFIAGAIGWIGPLAVGELFEHAGETVTVLCLTGWVLAVALGATASRGLAVVPDPAPAGDTTGLG